MSLLMKKLSSFIVLGVSCCLVFPGLLCAREIAVMPYLVETTSAAAAENIDFEYASLLGVAAVVEKGLSFYSMEQLKRDFKATGINPRAVLTEDDMQLLARRRMLRYIAAGTIYKTSKGYIAKTVLYDGVSNRIIAKSSVSGSTLFDTAQKDIRELFLYTNNSQSSAGETAQVESVLLLDLSYNMNRERATLVDSLKSHYESLFRSYPGSRLHCVLFNTRIKPSVKTFTTSGSLNVFLDSLNFNAGNNDDSISSALGSVIGDIILKKGSSRYLLMPINSNLKKSSLLVRFGNRAASKKIMVFPMLGARMDSTNTAAFRSLGERTGGAAHSLLYHQVFFDKEAKDFHLFMRSGRLYYSERPYPEWNRQFRSSEVKQKLDVPADVTPYALEKYYRDGLSRVVIKSEPLEVNFNSVCSDVFNKFNSTLGRRGYKQIIARVMFSSLKGSVWAGINDQQTLVQLQKMQRAGTFSPIGVRLQVDSSSVYGYSLNPGAYVFSIPSDSVPETLRVDLSELLSDPRRYSEKGFLDPPLWFINVKVERIEVQKGAGDVRS
ncbi:MAG: hypothetical protein PF637_04610 [Spirochaetes bacterium]|jgi:hypothetical protein|nr:hypothetical protein [Spirochaetota bacterium]